MIKVLYLGIPEFSFWIYTVKNRSSNRGCPLVLEVQTTFAEDGFINFAWMLGL